MTTYFRCVTAYFQGRTARFQDLTTHFRGVTTRFRAVTTHFRVLQHTSGCDVTLPVCADTRSVRIFMFHYRLFEYSNTIMNETTILECLGICNNKLPGLMFPVRMYTELADHLTHVSWQVAYSTHNGHSMTMPTPVAHWPVYLRRTLHGLCTYAGRSMAVYLHRTLHGLCTYTGRSMACAPTPDVPWPVYLHRMLHGLCTYTGRSMACAPTPDAP